MPKHIFKLTSDLSFSAVTKLANEMVQQSTFPDELKLADVSPVFKGGDTALKNNYRPSSVLSALSKVSECLLLKQFLPFIEKDSRRFSALSKKDIVLNKFYFVLLKWFVAVLTRGVSLPWC